MRHRWLWYGLDANQVQCSGVCWCLSRQLLASQLAFERIEVDVIKYFWSWQRHWPKHIDPKHL